MTGKPPLFAELKRRNVLRTAVPYAGAVWAISQGVSLRAARWRAPGCVRGFASLGVTLCSRALRVAPLQAATRLAVP